MAKFAPLFCLLPLAHGVRVKREQSKVVSVAGVPMQNYRADAEDFVIVFNKGVGDASIQDICKGKCKIVGSPDKGGLPFAQVKGWKEMEEVVHASPESIDILQPDELDHIIPDFDVKEHEGGMSIKSTPWGLTRVGAPKRQTTGRGVHVYVQDTGVRATHSDFGGRVVPTLDLTSGGVKECKGDQSCAKDGQGHGTHCAGTAAGSSYGVASDATIHAVKTLSDSGSGSRSWQISAIDWITSNGERPAVISMSLGGNGVDTSYTRVIGAATDAGVTVVVAGGNSNADACKFSPAFAEKAITVGSTTSSDSRSYFSNYGTCTNIWAPGSDITSASHRSDTGSATMSGTSMACPHTSGAVALLLEANPTMKSDAVLAQLLDNAGAMYITDLKGGDTNRLLYVGGDAPPPVGDVAPTEAPPPTPAPACPDYCNWFCWGSECRGCC